MSYFVGSLLVLAAGLKSWQVANSPGLLVYSSYSDFFHIVQIGIEFAVGIMALLGVNWAQVRALATGLFTAFAIYSFVLAIRGVNSCGCFGAVEVSPWWTFCVDLAVVVGLMGEKWLEVKQLDLNVSLRSCFHEKRVKHVWLLAICSVAWVLFLASVMHLRPMQNAYNPIFQAVANRTILTPESWINQSFPLKDMIDVDLSKGDWIVLLHRQDCLDCQIAVPQYEELSHKLRTASIALLEVPSSKSAENSMYFSCTFGRLSPDREWFVQTPVEIRIRDGIVVDASKELRTIHEMSSSSEDHFMLTGSTAHAPILKRGAEQ